MARNIGAQQVALVGSLDPIRSNRRPSRCGGSSERIDPFVDDVALILNQIDEHRFVMRRNESESQVACRFFPLRLGRVVVVCSDVTAPTEYEDNPPRVDHQRASV